MRPELRSFDADGYAGPVRILDRSQSQFLARYLARTEDPQRLAWKKGRAADDGLIARIGAHPALLALITPLLGDDVILWGASAVRQRAGQGHAWHADAESAHPEGRFVSAWIGVENVTAKSGLRFIAGSNHCGRTVQQARAEAGLARGQASDETVLEWARRDNPEAHLVEPAASDGDVILFDGRMWHGSANLMESGERVALLLQYAAADMAVRIPDKRNLDWPFIYLDEPRPAVIAVAGSASPEVNHVVPMPALAPVKARQTLAPFIRNLGIALAPEPDKDWQPFAMFRGPTAALDLMSCHAAVLKPGFSPHPPHAHQDEELLIVLEGEAELLIADRPEVAGARAVPVTAGDFAFYPTSQHHTIRNLSNAPVRYLMFRWNGSDEQPVEGRLPTRIYRAPLPVEAKDGRGFVVRRIFEGPTRCLRKLHCHATRLEPDAGYAPHADAYDVAILVQSGQLRTLGRKVGPGDLVYYPSGEVHGMLNIDTEAAHYLVFEFHGTPLATGNELAAGRLPAVMALA